MYFVNYFPTVVPTKKITLILLLRFPGNALQLDYITYNILSFWFHSQASKQTDLLLDAPVHTLLFLSETISIPENKQSKTWEACDSIYYTRSVLSKGQAANLVIQHADQLHTTRVLFLSQPKLNEALATCPMKPASTPDRADSSEDGSLLPLLEFSRLVASAASLPLLALATVCTGEPALCAAQRTLPGSR